MEQHYVTIHEVADYFKVSVPTIRGWLKKEVIPPSAYLKINNTFRFRLLEVEVALRGNTTPQDDPEATLEAAVVGDPRQLELNFNPDEDI